MDTDSASLFIHATRLARRDPDAAIALLRDARSRARALSDAEESAQLGSFLASLLKVAGRREEALEAYLEAEGDNPESFYLKLHLASFLTHVLGRPAEALPRITAALPALAEAPSSFHDGLSVLGSTLLALDRPEEAADAFRRMTTSRVLKPLPAVACDFWLVTELTEKHLLPEECRAYLAAIVRKAEDEGNAGIREHALRVLSKIPDGS
ncbi:MAG: hypothetical protein M3O15_01955 [Acidobacteriota bacterium]|nr:hypothetical protein [Acidobacteriota bacterium]